MSSPALLVRALRSSRIALGALTLIALAACDSDDITTKPPVLRDISVTAASTSLVVGQTTTATVAGIDQFGAAIATGAVTWASTASTIASVDANGVITAVAPGTVAIGATVGTLNKSVTVTVAATVLTTLTATAPTTSLIQGQTVTATATAVDQVGRAMPTGAVTWASGTATVASVSATGVITALTAGTTQITASAAGKTGQFTVTVAASPAIKVNEVESNGGTPGDWVELYNPTNAVVDISGWGLKDSDSTRTFKFPAGTTIPAGGYYVAEEAAFGYGLGAADDARLYNQYGVLIDSYSWTAHAAITYGRCPNATGVFTANSTSTKGAVNDCRSPIRINEVESSGGTPGDWIELINTGSVAVDISNYLVKDNDDSRTTRIAAGTTVAPGAFYIIDESVLGFGLGGNDAARIYDAAGTLVDSYTWTVDAPITYGRCPDGTGEFASNSASTKGATNQCGVVPPPAPTTQPWPGSDDVAFVDGLNVFATNGSGLAYEGAAGANPAVLWAVRNGPGTLFRMIFSGGIWTPDPANGWGTGKLLKYTDGTGNPDAEGVTFAGGGSAGGMYVATERNNDASSISRSVILRVVPSAAASLTATNQWDITADIPATGANLGLEAITWIPDSMLVANGFFDESKGRAYAPADYPDHAGGLFLVGVEANGAVHAYALNHTNNTFTRIATFASGFTTLAGGSSIMDLAYDRESGYLWAVCDDSCNGVMSIFEIDRTVGSPTRGKFISNRRYARPTTMPNINNEGFTFAPNSECVNNRKPVFWADDNETAGHTIRKATMPCGVLAPTVQGAVRARVQARKR